MTQNDQAQSDERMALAKLARRGYSQPGEVTNALSQLAQHFPVVAPGGTTNCAVIPEGFQALVTYVVAQPPEKDERGFDVGGDVFWHKGTKQWCFKHEFLKKLAAGLGLEWLEERRLDNFQHPFVCSILVRGRYRDYSGEWRQITGSTTLDLRDDAEHGMKPMQLKAARGKIHSLCASFAKSRAIADACVSRTVDERDLGRPIVMAKLYRSSAVDPEGAQEALYGDSGPEPSETIDESTGEVRTAQAEVRDATPEGPSFAERCAGMTDEQLETVRVRAQEAIDAAAAEDADEDTVARAKKASEAMDAIVREIEKRQPIDGVPF